MRSNLCWNPCIVQLFSIAPLEWLLRLSSINFLCQTSKINLITSKTQSPTHLYCSGLKSESHIPKDCFTCFSESPLQYMKNASYFILKARFVLKYLNFVLTFWSGRKNSVIRKISLISKLKRHNLVNKQLQYTHCPRSHKVSEPNNEI